MPSRIRSRIVDLLELVGIPTQRRANQFPHEFPEHASTRHDRDGDHNDPALLIADEPTTALDVTIRRRSWRCLPMPGHRRSHDPNHPRPRSGRDLPIESPSCTAGGL
jgi:ABC-type dipeptide/oligopeptide/nickel transport system ATPase subunit